MLTRIDRKWQSEKDFDKNFNRFGKIAIAWFCFCATMSVTMTLLTIYIVYMAATDWIPQLIEKL